MTASGRNATETAVWEMWTRILAAGPASVHDDFFDLGGQSLDLVRFLQEVWQAYQVELDMAELFAADFTVATSARAIDDNLARSEVVA